MSYNLLDTKFLNTIENEGYEWADEESDKTKDKLKKLPIYRQIKKRVKSILNEETQLPFGNIHNNYIYNFQTDVHHPQGVWRRISMPDYSKEYLKWEILIDFDELSKKLGKKVVFIKAVNCSYAPNLFLIHMQFDYEDVNPFMTLQLKERSDNYFFLEWDLRIKNFVDKGFGCIGSDNNLLEGKFTNAMWLDQNTVIFTPAFHKKDYTKYSYPDSLCLWKRGQSIEQAQKILKISKLYSDISIDKLVDTPTSTLVWVVVYKGPEYKDYEDIEYYVIDHEQKLQKILIHTYVKIVGSFKENIFFLLYSNWEKNDTIKAGSLVAIHWRDLVNNNINSNSVKQLFTPKNVETFDSIAATSDTVFLVTYDNFIYKISTFTLEGVEWTTPMALSLPYPSSVFYISASETDIEALVTFANPILPPTTYLWNKNYTFTLIRKALYSFNTDNYIFEQKEVLSSNGVKIPYFIAHKKDMDFNSKNPTIVMTYRSSKNINILGFNRIMSEIWLKKGGVFVVACIRGGEQVVRCGDQSGFNQIILRNRTSVNDYIAVIKDLVTQNITTPPYLGISSENNTTFLVSTMMNNHPELCGAVYYGTPVFDVGEDTTYYWLAGYGFADDPEALKYIEEDAPLKNIDLNVKYPHTFIRTAIRNEQIDARHGRILYYILQQNPNIKAYFIEKDDRGSALDIESAIDDYTNYYSFFADALKMRNSFFKFSF